MGTGILKTVCPTKVATIIRAYARLWFPVLPSSEQQMRRPGFLTRADHDRLIDQLNGIEFRPGAITEDDSGKCVAAGDAIILVLAGLMEPCGDIGTEARFLLLGYPWAKGDFAETVRELIQMELQSRECIITQPKELPVDQGDIDALSRGIGLRIWVIEGKSAPGCLDIHQRGWTSEAMNRAAGEVNRLSFHVDPIRYHWPSDGTTDANEIERCERFVIGQL